MALVPSRNILPALCFLFDVPFFILTSPLKVLDCYYIIFGGLSDIFKLLSLTPDVVLAALREKKAAKK